jgi:release factor glutamine methyltransferase
VTIQQRVAEARQRLHDAGLSAAEAALSARLLAEHVLRWDTTRFLTDAHGAEPANFPGRYGPLVARRALREPLAYIVGEQEFWNLKLEVSSDVLIPRPETELIVEAALEVAGAAGESLLVADACTGSGCLAIALARELPGARVVATDIADAALAVARRNAARHGVDARIDFVRTDVLAGVDGPFGLIVANPPYVRAGDAPGLQPEVRDHEPSVALYGGPDGLELVARLVAQAASRLADRAHLIFEFGFGQDADVEALISNEPRLALVGLRRDLRGIARTAVVERAS